MAGMGEINITDSRGRDAVVATESVAAPLRVRWLDARGRQAVSTRLVRSTLNRDLAALKREAGGLEKVADALLAGDPEIDFELYGRETGRLWRVYVDPDGEVVHHATQWEIVRNPDETERERRPRQVTQPNTNTERPLKWTGRMLPKSEVFNRFVFSSKVQLVHVNGLTYDFLFRMAKELEEKDSILLLGAGPKGNAPLVFRRGGTPYRGFLEGRTDGDRYLLVLHLSNLEFKAPAAVAEEAAATAVAEAEAAAAREGAA